MGTEQSTPAKAASATALEVKNVKNSSINIEVILQQHQKLHTRLTTIEEHRDYFVWAVIIVLTFLAFACVIKFFIIPKWNKMIANRVNMEVLTRFQSLRKGKKVIHCRRESV